MEKEMNLEELAEQATPLAATDSDVTNIEDDAPEEDDGLIISDEDTNEPEKKEEEYTGSGVVIDKPEKNHNSQGNVVIGPLANKERSDDIARTMNELDEEIAEAKKIHDKIKEKEANGEKVEKINNNPEEESKEETKDNSDSDVKILIDKIGMGTVTFTDEEKKRIRFSKKIDLVEDNFFFLAVDLPDLFFILWIEVDFFLKGERIPGGAKHAVCDFSVSD